MDDTFNMRNPQPGEVAEMHLRAKKLREAKLKYKVLSQALDGKKEIDITVSPEIFEALNREKLEFETLLNMPQNQKNIQDCIEAVKEDRKNYTDGKYWNPQSKARWGILGHIPNCCFYARPLEYWKDKNLLKNFLNTFTKFRISTKKI